MLISTQKQIWLILWLSVHASLRVKLYLACLRFKLCELSVLGQVLISGMFLHFQESYNSFYEGEFLEKYVFTRYKFILRVRLNLTRKIRHVDKLCLG